MKKQDRRKFLFTGLSLATLWATIRFSKQSEKPKAKTMKFLTQDGKLVEVDMDKMPTKKQTASKEDMQNWVMKNKHL